MGACKILLISLAVLAIKARVSRSHILQDPTQDCGCFPIDKDGVRISTIADKYGKNERKVIYIFKRPDSEEVMVYVPNEEKQKIFPDLTVNSLETYGLPKFEHLYQVFKDPTNVSPTVSTMVKPNSIDTNSLNSAISSIDTSDINLLLPEKPFVTDTNSDKKLPILEIKPGSTDQLNIHAYPITENGEKVTSDVNHSTGDKISALELPNQAGTSVDQSGKPIIQIIEDVYLVPGHGKKVTDKVSHPEKHIIPNKDLISGHDEQNIDHLNNHLVNQAIGIIESGDNKNILDLSNMINIQDQPKGNINLIPVHDNNIPHQLNENKKNLNQDTNAVPNVDSESKPIHDSSSDVQTGLQSTVPTEPSEGEFHVIENTMLAQGTGTNFINSLTEMLVGNNNKALLPPEKIKPANSPLVDKWLFEQIQNVGNTVKGISSLNLVDLQRIKIHLLIILEQNGISLSENGDLTDINGNIFKISNLKLRRVLISDPAVYKQIMEGRKCVIPHDIPYLEAVFVNLVYPPKVLGLIPLKMTHLPRCKGSRCQNKICRHTTINKPGTMNIRGPKKLNLLPIKNKQLKSTNLFLSDKQEQTPQNGPIVKMEEIILPHVIGVSDDHVGDKDGDKTPTGDNDDDGLGIRIIGGHAATSSGTPVSSRGRGRFYKAGTYSI